MYTALTPIYRPAGVNATTYTRTGALVTSEQFYVEWKELGPASDMADAKRLYGGYPVLEWRKPW